MRFQTCGGLVRETFELCHFAPLGFGGFLRGNFQRFKIQHTDSYPMVFQHSDPRDVDLGGEFQHSGSYHMVFQHSARNAGSARNGGRVFVLGVCRLAQIRLRTLSLSETCGASAYRARV